MAAPPAPKPPANITSTFTIKKAGTAGSTVNGAAVKVTLGPRGRNIDAKKAGITPVQQLASVQYPYMGQNVVGVLLGVELKAKAYDKLCFEQNGVSLLEQWNHPTGARDVDRWPARGDRVEAIERSNHLIGVWIACSHGDDKGVPDLEEAISFSMVAKGRNYKRAQSAWKKFAKWASKKGVKLGKPQVFLAPTEVA